MQARRAEHCKDRHQTRPRGRTGKLEYEREREQQFALNIFCAYSSLVYYEASDNGLISRPDCLYVVSYKQWPYMLQRASTLCLVPRGITLQVNDQRNVQQANKLKHPQGTCSPGLVPRGIT